MLEDKEIYDALDKVEKFAIKLAKINRFFKARRKRQKKKDKKIYKTNKKTGALVYKKIKKQKGATLHKRYPASKISKDKK